MSNLINQLLQLVYENDENKIKDFLNNNKTELSEINVFIELLKKHFQRDEIYGYNLDEDFYQKLLKNHIYPSYLDLENWAYEGYFALLEFFLKNNAPFDKNDETLVYTAETHSYNPTHERHAFNIVKILLDRGAIIKDNLLLNATRGHLSIVKLLVERGVSITDEVLAMAKVDGAEGVFKFLMNKRKDRIIQLFTILCKI
jgi:mevalonate kinase